MLNRLLGGFEGKLTTSKWAALAKASQDTALRDIDELVVRGVLVKDAAGGRSTSYSLAHPGKQRRDVAAINETVARARALPVLDDRTDEGILDYDEDGLPT